jgi:hypothetical protein
MWKLGLRPRYSQKRNTYINGIAVAVYLAILRFLVLGGKVKFTIYRAKIRHKSYKFVIPVFEGAILNNIYELIVNGSLLTAV